MATAKYCKIIFNNHLQVILAIGICNNPRATTSKVDVSVRSFANWSEYGLACLVMICIACV